MTSSPISFQSVSSLSHTPRRSRAARRGTKNGWPADATPRVRQGRPYTSSGTDLPLGDRLATSKQNDLRRMSNDSAVDLVLVNDSSTRSVTSGSARTARTRSTMSAGTSSGPCSLPSNSGFTRKMIPGRPGSFLAQNAEFRRARSMQPVRAQPLGLRLMYRRRCADETRWERFKLWLARRVSDQVERPTPHPWWPSIGSSRRPLTGREDQDRRDSNRQRLKTHSRTLDLDGLSYTILSPRPAAEARFATNRYHETWHVITDISGAQLLARLCWAMAFQRHARTITVIDQSFLLPNPFDADPSCRW